MTGFLDKLNLTQQERRLVIGVGVVLFLVLNFVLIWPQFGELSKAHLRTKELATKLRRFQDEVGKRSEYERELKRLEGAGGYVASEEQALALSKEVTAQALTSGVRIDRNEAARTASGGRTNSFFEEQSLTIQVVTGEQELIDFLYSLGAKNSLIRVRSMTLGRDPSQMRLAGPITLVKSFQRKPPVKPSTPATPPPTTAAPSKSTNLPPKATPTPTPKAAPAVLPAPSLTPRPTNFAPRRIEAPPVRKLETPKQPAPAVAPAKK